MMKFLRILALGGLAVLACGCSGNVRPPATPALSAETEVANVRRFLSQVQDTFNTGNLDSFMEVFADDAVQLSPGQPDTVGKAAIRSAYEAALASNDIKVDFNTSEIEVSGELAYERGTYVIHVSSKSDGKRIADIENRHVHIMRRQADGSWKTWRMMTNSPAPAAP